MTVGACQSRPYTPEGDRRSLTLQRHFRVLTKFAHVESWLSGRKRQKEKVFYAPVNLCDRRACSASVAVGLGGIDGEDGAMLLDAVPQGFKQFPHGLKAIVIEQRAHALP
jgi:hypothetical protein